MPAPPGATVQQAGVREYKLTENANFNVAVKVTKGYDTRRQEEGAILGEMVTQQPQMMSVIGDLYFGSQDWPWANQSPQPRGTVSLFSRKYAGIFPVLASNSGPKLDCSQ
jgi:hypothetical protein